MKIFVNAYLEQNLGDDLFFYILKNRYPQHTFYVLSTFWNNESNVKVYRNPIYNKIIKKLQIKSIIANRCDIAISLGGSIYIEDENSKNRKFSLGKNPCYVVGSNFGPYVTQEFYQKAYEFFKRCRRCMF